jgi:hypothetical protein
MVRARTLGFAAGFLAVLVSSGCRQCQRQQNSCSCQCQCPVQAAAPAPAPANALPTPTSPPPAKPMSLMPVPDGPVMRPATVE